MEAPAASSALGGAAALRACATSSRLISAGRGNLGASPNPPSASSKRDASMPAHALMDCAAALGASAPSPPAQTPMIPMLLTTSAKMALTVRGHYLTAVPVCDPWLRVTTSLASVAHAASDAGNTPCSLVLWHVL